MNGGVVEFDALPDADGTRAEYDHFLPVRNDALVLLLIGRVKIGNIALEFRSAGVDHLVDRGDAVLPAQFEDRLFGHVPEAGDRTVGEAEALGFPQFVEVARRFSQGLLLFDDPADGAQEEGVDAGGFADEIRGGPFDLWGEMTLRGAVRPFDPRGQMTPVPPQQRRDSKDPVVRSRPDVGEQRIKAPPVELGRMQVEETRLERAHRLEQARLESTPDAHDLAGRLHLRGQRIVRVSEFVEGEPRHLGDDIVQRWLERCRRVGKGDLVERHADADLRGDTRDRVTARLGRQRRGTRDARIHLDQIILE